MILHHILPSVAAAAASSLSSSPFASLQICGGLAAVHGGESRQAPPEDYEYVMNNDKAQQYSLNITFNSKTNTKKTKKKTVRFNDVNVEFYDCSRIIYTEDYGVLWYSVHEINRFKDANIDFAGQIAHADRQRQNKANKNCKQAADAHDSYQNILKRTYQACCQCSHETDNNILTRHEELHLIKWLDCELHRLGTERKTVAEIGRDRRHRRSRLIDMVLIIQETTMQTQSHQSNNNRATNANADAMARVMSDSCQQISRASRLFARHLAMAQAAAAC
jgi:hypothetical protein